MKKLLLGVLALSTTIALTGCKNKKSSKGNGLHFEEWIDCYKVYHLDGDISGDIVIPKTYNDKPVTIIPRYGFMDCTDITSITLTENILTISTAAFSNCTKLKFNEYENGYYLDSICSIVCTICPTGTEINYVNPGKAGQKVKILLPKEAKVDYILRRKK